MKYIQDDITADEKSIVCWEANGLGEKLNGPCWEDKECLPIADCRSPYGERGLK